MSRSLDRSQNEKGVLLGALREKRTFQNDLAEHRCLIPADGFYEWKTLPNGKKVPFRIVRKDGDLFAFAGIWEDNKRDGFPETRFAIITTAANDLMKPIHGRMPVILGSSEEAVWLDKNVPMPKLLECLKPAPSRELKAYEVSRMVTRGTVDTPEIIEPI